MPIPKEKARYMVLDEEGAGRCGLGEATVGAQLGAEKVARAGARTPDSGRTDLHPLVVDLIKTRFGITLTNTDIHLLQPENITNDLIVLVLTDLCSVPPYVFLNAYDVLHAPVEDPFPKLDSQLNSAADQIQYYSILFAYLANTQFETFGTSKDESGIIIPRRLLALQPPEWEREYMPQFRDLLRFPNSGGLMTSEEHPRIPNRNPVRSFFDDEWGETPAIVRPYSWLNASHRF